MGAPDAGSLGRVHGTNPATIKWEVYAGRVKTFADFGFKTVLHRFMVRAVMRYSIGTGP